MFRAFLLILIQSSFAYADSFVLPVSTGKVSSDFGFRLHPIKGKYLEHKGIDIAAPYGAKVRCISEGTVIFSGSLGGYGELIVIKHVGDATTHYGHLSERVADVGDRVLKGQIIGNVGKSGAVTGSHLHFEMRIEGLALDPKKLFGALISTAAK